MVSEINNVIEIRRDDLSRVKTGAVTHSEPKIVWIKMINRVGCYDKELAIRNKFNSILENELSGHSGHYVIDLNQKLNDASLFSNNNLTKEGKVPDASSTTTESTNAGQTLG